MREWLLTIRKAAGMSEKAVADAAGISQPSYHRIEAGTRNPTVETEKAIGEVLDFRWTRFFVDEKAS